MSTVLTNIGRLSRSAWIENLDFMNDLIQSASIVSCDEL